MTSVEIPSLRYPQHAFKTGCQKLKRLDLNAKTRPENVRPRPDKIAEKRFESAWRGDCGRRSDFAERATSDEAHDIHLLSIGKPIPKSPNTEITKSLNESSREWDLNPRPAVYETAALPLSYLGLIMVHQQ
jgi:hypothetical protein